MSQNSSLFVLKSEPRGNLLWEKLHRFSYNSPTLSIMKLETYFYQEGNKKLSDERKIALYQRICEERSRVSHNLERTKILRTRKIYAFLSFVLIFSFLWIYFWDFPKLIEYRAFWAEKNPTWSHVVSADYIAEVLEINGDYIIEKEGKTFQNSVLFDWDLITSKENAKIIFNINDNIKTEIQWPAKFTISKVSEWKYHLFLMEWDFLKIDSDESFDILQVETDEMTIETNKDEKVALTLTKVDHRTELENKWSSLLVKDKTNQEEEITLEPEKLLTMEANDITHITDIKEFATALTSKWNLTYTTTLPKEDTIEWDLNEKTPEVTDIETLIKENDDFLTSNSAIPGEIEENISSDLAYNADEKVVPTENQLSQITAALNSSFLMWDVKELYLAKESWDSNKIASAYRNILWRVKAVADVCNVDISLDPSAKSVLTQIDLVVNWMKHYYFPPTKETQLNTLKNWINYIENTPIAESREIFESQLPSNLRFKIMKPD